MRSPSAGLVLLSLVCLAGWTSFLSAGCGTLGEGDGGGSNLPSRGIIPFSPLSPGDHPQVDSLPLVVTHETARLDEPCAVLRDDGVWMVLEACEAERCSILGVVSQDGIAFGSPQPVLEPELDWEEGWVGAPAVVQEDHLLLLWYVGGVEHPAIGLATSEDGVQFAREPEPVLAPPSGVWVGSPSVVRLEGGYALFYTMVDERASDQPQAAVIARADSPDGRSWVFSETVLQAQEGCTDPEGNLVECWDGAGVASPGARLTTSSAGRRQFDLWYTSDGRADADIGFAGSYDGREFSRYRLNPVVGGDEPQRAACVLSFGGSSLMYYATQSDRVWGIAVARSDL
ncbi:MAG: hypothetical protein JW797_03935 [Bradymonadales bacterium]|nr:hypothetical protein [Bradymonadales bacterium]